MYITKCEEMSFFGYNIDMTSRT